MSEKIHIVGIGDDGLDGLTSSAKSLVETAQIIIGAENPLSCLSDSVAEKVEIGGNLDEIVNTINASSDKRIVILALGDPLFFGTARYLCDKIGKERFEVVPHVSIMQLAFARVKESWDEAYLTNLASNELDSVLEKIRIAQRVGLFTTEQSTPNMVAQGLLDRGINYFSAFVCENLGSPNERVTHSELEDIVSGEFSSLNVMVLVRKPDVPETPVNRSKYRLFGNPDEVFVQSKPKRGLLTPSEVRSQALAEMAINADSVVWDIGAGCGSVAIEAAQLASQGKVYAIEMDPEDYQLISENAIRFEVNNLQPILGKAPEAWSELPSPDAIFVGGTGRVVKQICELAFERLKKGGHLVVNVGSIENVAEVYASLQPNSTKTDAWMVNISRGNDQMERLRFESLNPTFLISAQK